MSTLVSFHAHKAGWAGRNELEVIADEQTFRELCQWIDVNTDTDLFPCTEDGGEWESFADAPAYKDGSGRIVARDLDRMVDLDGDYNTYYIRDIGKDYLTEEEWAALDRSRGILGEDARRALAVHKAEEYLPCPLDAVTLDEFCDMLNREDGWLPREDGWLPVFSYIIEAKGWQDHSGSDYGVCSDGERRIETAEDGRYIVMDGNGR